ncbi:uncharacterized protein F4822DRAFT_417937 [Hypoxylon trugodes]|uniref:uncharacterized protein n=1 Tax=Hypoxylon trugodes TaxID=326681 RepID=UPI002195D334|nr:uncharacterized protein F4822DRAFT_417937 [Hypoxylon trugodes]KAI1383894.1 hypothetical protein F4822DRAFT_417937 [Hypoxylon trugodes]
MLTKTSHKQIPIKVQVLVSKMAIQEFPVEITKMVFELVNKPDLQSLRLVSKAMKVIASTILFRRAYASIYSGDTQVLQAISQHPELRHCVRELVYCGTTPTESIYYCDDEGLTPSPPTNLRFRFKRIAWKEGFAKSLIDAMSMMPRVQKVTLTNHICSEYCPLVARRANLDTLLTLGKPAWAPEPPEPMFPPEVKAVILPVMQFDLGFKVMCEVISISGHQVTELSTHFDHNLQDTAGNQSTTFWEKQGLVFGSLVTSPRYFEHTCNTFRQLRKIKLAFEHDFDRLGMANNPRCVSFQRNLMKALAEAKNLEELELEFLFMENDLDELVGCMSKLTWPFLRSLTLIDIEVDLKKLVAILANHSKTLRSLNLRGISLSHGNWKEAANEFNKLRLPRIESVSFSWLGCHHKEESTIYISRDSYKPQFGIKGVCGPNYGPLLEDEYYAEDQENEEHETDGGGKGHGMDDGKKTKVLNPFVNWLELEKSFFQREWGQIMIPVPVWVLVPSLVDSLEPFYNRNEI